MNKLLFWSIWLGLVQSAAAQSQLAFDVLNDFGDGTTQTFVAESSASLSGVSLVVFGHGSAADTTVQIRDLLADGSLDSDILATGVLLSEEVPTDAADWRFVEFDTPVNLLLGDDYGLVINPFDSGPSGFNDYGASRDAPYENGELLIELFAGQPLRPIFPTADLTFILTTPEPASVLLVGIAVLGFSNACRRPSRI